MSVSLAHAIDLLTSAAKGDSATALNLYMPGDPRYQPNELKPYLGYDQWARWLTLVEWYWLETLADAGVVPGDEYRQCLSPDNLEKVLETTTTTKQDAREKATNHDIIALQDVMRPALSEVAVPWLHYCATSYDIIETAYVLQALVCFEKVFWPKLESIDCLWRQHIKDHASTLQAGRTHLQTALPVTVGFWLANLHRRFVECARQAREKVLQIPGKFSGATGTAASQRALIADSIGLEGMLLDKLSLPSAGISTQITPPEARARFYHELVLLSGALANLGEDVRILQSSQFGELGSASSTSSAMSHKEANPIAAEQVAGMHVTVIAEYQRVLGTLVSDLQRDLRASSVMRGFPAIMVYVYQQLLTTERLLKSLTVKADVCRANFEKQGRLVPAEALHLSLQTLGIPQAHHFVNQEVVPRAKTEDLTLAQVIAELSQKNEGPITPAIYEELQQMPAWPFLESPELYIGDAERLALEEAQNEL